MARTTAQDIDLSSIWLFAPCSSRDLRKIRQSLDEITVEEGEVLCNEGDAGHEFFIIVEGTATVKRKGRRVATLGPGQYFGELALLDRQPRSATVVAASDMVLLVLEQRHFLGLLDMIPTLSRKLLGAMATRLRESDRLAFHQRAVELSQAVRFARDRHQGVLVTIRRDGRPQASNIAYQMDAEGTARVSVTEGRAKTKNLRRDPRAVLYVPGDSFWQYAVLDGTVYLGVPAQDPDDATVDELVEIYRLVRGEEHPDWDEFRQAMAQEHRLALRFVPTSASGILPS